MTNAELIQKIRAEIERQIENLGISDEAILIGGELSELLSFLSTLESEKPMNLEGLEEEIHKYNKERFDEYFPEQDGDFISEVDFMTCLDRVARHFAQWGAEHLASIGKTSPKDLEEAAEKYAEDNTWVNEFTNDGEIPEWYKHTAEVFKAGAEWMKEQYHFFNEAWADDMQYQLDRNYENGKQAMKEQMMKEAVEAEISIKFPIVGRSLISVIGMLEGFEYGDKVRVIVLPKED